MFVYNSGSLFPTSPLTHLASRRYSPLETWELEEWCSPLLTKLRSHSLGYFSLPGGLRAPSTLPSAHTLPTTHSQDWADGWTGSWWGWQRIIPWFWLRIPMRLVVPIINMCTGEMLLWLREEAVYCDEHCSSHNWAKTNKMFSPLYICVLIEKLSFFQ